MLSRGFCRTFGVRSPCARPVASAIKFKACNLLLYASTSSVSPVLTTRDGMANDDAIADLLKPVLLWRYFKDLTQIPRPSKHEERVLQYLKDFAAERQLPWQQDAGGNLVIRRPRLRRRRGRSMRGRTGACGYGLRERALSGPQLPNRPTGSPPRRGLAESHRHDLGGRQRH
ncbi:hypothetical protein VaNZ11_014535, partial [Volvox africanus]